MMKLVDYQSKRSNFTWSMQRDRRSPTGRASRGGVCGPGKSHPEKKKSRKKSRKKKVEGASVAQEKAILTKDFSVENPVPGHTTISNCNFWF